MAVILYLADRTGLEPATSAVTGRHSNQLNYRSLFVPVGDANIRGNNFYSTKLSSTLIFTFVFISKRIYAAIS